jgi:DnaJ-class molecular chaperone with C-terminal Zn finger domain
LGWIWLGPIGGLIGFAVGAVIDAGISAVNVHRVNDSDEEDDSARTGRGGWQSTGGYPGYSRGYGQNSADAVRNSFMASLLVMATAVVKSDGKFLKSELELIKSFISQNFGEDSVAEGLQIVKKLYSQNIDVASVGGQIRQYMNYSQRMQLYHFLVQLAGIDGDVSQSEVNCLKQIAFCIGLSDSDRDSMMNINNPEDIASAYKILEIQVTSTDDEVVKAYRKMAMKYHPDKVSTLGADVQKAAEEKFKNIVAAYETIKKARNMN